ncbi:hypothetical protein ACFOHK_01060 [Falsigemmobacter intermedius]|uniref:Uncharacterized protein n=1 Tax=Falsigemmobacter intermedius TaxID=1553448 RepID=A0A451GH22_9RHOB|nr:hypothetical protein [Falsigemmobacter intermedius]RWY37345.1 hypothetical protein EP867_17315 [Falsigemmobacter intermedius]
MSAPLSALDTAWLHARDAFGAAALKPGASEFDTPESKFWISEMDRFQDMIEVAEVRTQEDAAAMIKFIWTDANADGENCPQVRKSVLSAVKEWAAKH